jgi:predicted metal-dependent HD superfamily phosphohydrolase
MATQDQQTGFAELWGRLMDFFKVPRNLHCHVFAQLVAAYSEPHRHYHNLDHIDWMLNLLHLDVMYSTPFPNPEWKVLELASWFHDVVYDPRSSENESRSAEVARNSLRELDLSTDLIARVSELIMMTKDHQAPPMDFDALLFLDLDLSILASVPKKYEEYARAIRKEYAWVGDREFYLGRRKVLQVFLERTVFRTDWFRPKEPDARLNIHREIAQIDEILRNLPP